MRLPVFHALFLLLLLTPSSPARERFAALETALEPGRIATAPFQGLHRELLVADLRLDPPRLPLPREAGRRIRRIDAPRGKDAPRGDAVNHHVGWGPHGRLDGDGRVPGLRAPDRMPPPGPAVIIAPTPTAAQLPLDGDGTLEPRIVKVADVVVSTSNRHGCLMTLASGPLARTQGGAGIDVDVALVDPRDGPPSAARFSGSSGGEHVVSTQRAGVKTWALYVRYPPPHFAEPGDYATSIRIVVEDNR